MYHCHCYLCSSAKQSTKEISEPRILASLKKYLKSYSLEPIPLFSYSSLWDFCQGFVTDRKHINSPFLPYSHTSDGLRSLAWEQGGCWGGGAVPTVAECSFLLLCPCIDVFCQITLSSAFKFGFLPLGGKFGKFWKVKTFSFYLISDQDN